MATSRLTIACFLASSREPTAIVTESTVGIATGIAATVRDQGELQGGQDRVAAQQGGDDNDGDQRNRQDDQVVADLEHGALEMADGFRVLHQLGGFPEVGVGAGGIHQERRSHLA